MGLQTYLGDCSFTETKHFFVVQWFFVGQRNFIYYGEFKNQQSKLGLLTLFNYNIDLESRNAVRNNYAYFIQLYWRAAVPDIGFELYLS